MKWEPSIADALAEEFGARWGKTIPVARVAQMIENPHRLDAQKRKDLEEIQARLIQPTETPEEIEEQLAASETLGIWLRKSDNGSPGCWFAGDPSLPADIEWPWFEPDGKRLAPMYFLAQINLAEVRDVVEYDDLPNKGVLYFFADLLYARDFYWKDGGKVIYCADDAGDGPPRAMPAIPQTPAWAETHYNFWGVALPPREHLAPRQDMAVEDYTAHDVHQFPSKQFHDAAMARNETHKHELFARIWPDEKPPQGAVWRELWDHGHYFFFPPHDGTWNFSDHWPLLSLYPDKALNLDTAEGARLTFKITPADLAAHAFELGEVFEAS